MMRIKEPKRILYINKIDLHIWIVLGLAVLGYVLINLSWDCSGLHFPWKMVLSQMCISVVTGFVFFTIAAHYANQQRKEKDEHEVMLSLYHIVLDANHFLAGAKSFHEMDINELNAAINKQMDVARDFSQPGTEPLRKRVDECLAPSIPYMVNLNRYASEHDLSRLSAKLLRRLQIINDPTPNFDTLVYRAEIRSYFMDLCSVMRLYEFDFSDVMYPVLKRVVKEKKH